MTNFRYAVFPLVPLVVACGASGAMRQATLVGQCAASGTEPDAACARKGPLAPLAIGTRFYPEASTTIDGTATPLLRLESAAPGILAVEDGALVAKQPGASAVLISTDDGSVVDFIHVWVAPVTKVTLARRDGERIGGAIGLAVGEDVTIVPALWSGSQRLAGDGDPQWSVTDDKAVTVLRDGSSDRRRIRARAPGKSTVTVAFGDSLATVDVEVVP